MKFKNFAREDNSIVDKFYSLLRQSVSGPKHNSNNIYQTQHNIEYTMLQKILQRWRNLYGYEKQLDILNLNFAFK